MCRHHEQIAQPLSNQYHCLNRVFIKGILMAKDDWPPLLHPGFHETDVSSLHEKFVKPFGNNDRRRDLTERLTKFINKFSEFGVQCEIWLDGSYVTEKPMPNDVDVVVLLNAKQVNQMSPDALKALSDHLDRNTAKARYSCDVYYIEDDHRDKKAYWRGLFGFCHDQKTPKGLAVVRVSA